MAEHDHQHNTHEHVHDEHEHTHQHDEHEHTEDEHGGHGHTHGTVNPDLYGNKAGLRAVQISTAGMLLVSIIQFVIAIVGNSAGLFADALHNTGDVLTTIALWIAFALSRRAANQRYTYGYYRAEDLAGVFIVLVIIASAVASAIESINKLTSGTPPTQLYLSMTAAVVGIVGNEVLAQYKISVGKRINSVPLIADGQHSRIDGLTSLAAFIGLIGAALGFPIADPIAGLVITVVILTVVYSTAKSVLQRLLDSVDARVVPTIIREASAVPGVEGTDEVRARWVGHTLHIAMNIEVDAELTLRKAHEIAEEVRHRLFHNLEGVSEVIIHTDPHSHDGKDPHKLTAHHMQEAQRSIAPR
ncbi:cation transporter [Reticulibacter mediterranei]|uniref:Cation transporter n=1 Tax=Reticulibacter mediterranei TaxID=2778369 RepID=A0A8J3IGB3_9CHLR|nr:cation diffusion facilitator family transporter [Reticulibacter mediterranei]GHO92023.1 cation transporter [Reticulibacter mediterranei]